MQVRNKMSIFAREINKLNYNMKRFFISAIVTMSCFMANAQTISIPAVNLAPGGEKTVSVSLENATQYTAFQFDIALPTGVTVKSVDMDNKPDTRKIEKGTVGGKFRVLSYDNGNAKFTSGSVLSMTFKADDNAAAEENEAEVSTIVVVKDDATGPDVATGTVAINVSDKAKVSITAAEQAIVCSDLNLDFSSVTDVKAYIVTGHDKATGKIWLSRIYDVPAGTAVLLMGAKGNYDIPVVAESKHIYKNMLVGSLAGTTIYKDGGENLTNYILSKPEGKEVGFYFAKDASQGGSSVKAGGGYLPLPTTIAAVGEAGSTVTISMNKYGMKSYCPSTSLDFSNVQGLNAYTATGYSKTGVISLTRLKAVPAGLGILLMAPAEKKDYDVPTASLQQCYANMFEGTLTDKTIYQIEDGIVNYYLSVKDDVVGYYLAETAANNGTKISANGSWLPVPKYMTSLAARAFNGEVSGMPESLSVSLTDEVISMNIYGSIDGDDDTTGIRELMDNGSESDAWYNLKGQRIDSPTKKGLYIHNGRKVVVK